ncbi:MAG TPA: MucB/RseB C-terminal domain-containing protein [Steroidobacteraceae bacterium]|nr:MucB/RseB C-terminal domain-containing protein [Steroidobacteraceae bacterium]
MPRATRASEALRAPMLAWAVAAAAGACAAGAQPAASAAPAAAAGQKSMAPATPAQWLERMNTALTTGSYEGTFSHWHGGTVEMLRIVHRLQDGQVAERLVSLDGSGREFIRTGSSLACYLPDRRTVLVEQRSAQESLVGFPAINAQTATFYDIREVARMRLNRRATHVIAVAPRDEFRYGYRLWIDDSTAMPLKTQLCDTDGRVVEQLVFADLRMAAHIPDSEFQPEVSTAGFQWLRNEATQPAPAPAAATIWSALKLPPGFRMMLHGAQTLPGSSAPVDHLVFSDGLASVSVFVEVRPAGDAATTTEVRSARLGSSSAFSTTANGYKITAVGEVPPATVQLIASEVRAGETATPAATPAANNH